MPKKFIERKFTVTDFFSSFNFSWNKDFVFNGESHEMWEIVYILSGKVEVTENEKIYLLEKNNMIIHAPWEFHRIKSADGTSPSLYVMSFYAEGELPKKLSEGVFALTTDQIVQYKNIFGKIYSLLNENNTSSYAGQDAADRLSTFLIEISEEDVAACLDMSPAATEYRKIVLAMSNGVCKNKVLTDFARECGDSVSYIKKLFAKYAGISPKSYYNLLRVQKATELLNGGNSVSEVSLALNFSSSFGLVNRTFHTARNSIGVHYNPTFRISCSTAYRLNKRSFTT